MARKHEFPDSGHKNGKGDDKEFNYGDKAEKNPREDKAVARAAYIPPA